MDCRLWIVEVQQSKIDNRKSLMNMEDKYDYKQLDVYKEAKALVKIVYELLKKFPREEQYALCDQLRRAAISVPSNIAEGSGRRSAKEQVHFLEIANGSLREVDCQLDIACDLGYISSDEIDEVARQIQKVGSMLTGLRKYHQAVDNRQSKINNRKV